MTKRKAQVELDDSHIVEPASMHIHHESSPPKSRRTQHHHDTSNTQQLAIRKRVTQNFSDLSQLNDFNTTQQPHLKAESVKSSVGQRAGYIEQIKLKNFKCHGSLEFTLHPYINFILGRNGSGKSAVMDAIILCLGGRTTFTGRHASAKTFIKTNCDRAELSITIVNEGSDAYKHNIYGNRIVVERKINKDGVSAYRLLDEDKKMITAKKSELDNIVEQFNIQVDNPVCFLNQETSKHFLNSSNPADKYKLFMKASQLESMKVLQELIEKERLISENLIKEKLDAMPRLEEELYIWEEKFKKCQSADKLKQTYNMLMREYSWAYVINWEKLMESSHKERLKIIANREKHQSKIEFHQKKFDESTQEFENVEKSIAQLNLTYKNSTKRGDELNKIKQAATQNLKLKEAEKKKISLFVEKKQRDRTQLVDKLNEEKNKLQSDLDEERIRKETQLAEINAKMTKNRDTDKELTQEHLRLNREIEAKTVLVNGKNIDLKGIETKIRDIESDITRSRNASNNKIFRFGDYMQSLTNDIKQHYDNGRFKQMPRGPIGMHVQPKNQEWSLAIEQCLGAYMTSFICGNFDDEKLMHQLLNKHHQKGRGPKPRVVVTEFSTPLYNSNQFRPLTPEHSTVLEMLNIDDPIVANTLMDLRKIEGILLLPDLQTGTRIIERRSDPKCQEAFLKNGDQLLGKPTFRMYGCKMRQPQCFVENTQMLLEAKQRDLRELKEQQKNYQNEINQLTHEMGQIKQSKTVIDRKVDAIRREHYSLNNQLKDTENIKIPEPADLAVFEEEIEKLTNVIEELTPKLSQLNEAVVQAREEYKQAEKECNDHDDEMKIHFDKVQELKSNYTSLDQQRNSDTNSINYFKNHLNDCLVKESEIEKTIGMQQHELDRLIKAAEDLCSRIHTKKSVKTIESEIQAVELQIKQNEKEHGNEEEITKKYKEMGAKFDKIKKDIDKQSKFLSKLKKALDNRESKTHVFTQGKALRCSMDFSKLLNSRNYKGNLIFDHENQVLNIDVQPNKTKDKVGVKDLKTLSGGERSFSTVAFLLSLWSIVESPLLFLDEFDVFMDQINRSFAMDLILSHSKEKLDGQYVFLTPQDMGSVRPDEYVKMFKMPDPRRAIDLHNNQENQENEYNN